jgi:hypothetical protein
MLICLKIGTLAVLFCSKELILKRSMFFLNLHHSRTNPKSPFQTQVVPRRGNVITLSSTSLQDIKLECEGCRVVFIKRDEFLTFMAGLQQGVTRWVPHVEHLSSPEVFSGVRVARSLCFCVMFCRSLSICLFVLTIALSVLPFTASSIFSQHIRAWPQVLFLSNTYLSIHLPTIIKLFGRNQRHDNKNRVHRKMYV